MTFKPPTAETHVFSPLRALLEALASGRAVTLDGLSVIPLSTPDIDETSRCPRRVDDADDRVANRVLPLRGTLEIRAPEGQTRLALSAGRHVVGRSSSCQIRLRDPCVSRRHAELRIRDDGTVSVRDLDSAGGTRVGDERVSFAEVDPSASIVLADTAVLRWHCAERRSAR